LKAIKSQTLTFCTFRKKLEVAGNLVFDLQDLIGRVTVIKGSPGNQALLG